MFLITIEYNKPLDIVDQYVAEHRAYLEQGYEKNWFIVSGPKSPRTGGIILSNLADKRQVEAIIKQDPYYVHDVACFEITEFSPVRYHPNFAGFLETK